MKLTSFFFPLFPVVLFSLLFLATDDAHAHDHASHETGSALVVSENGKHCASGTDDAHPDGNCCKSLQVAQTDSTAHVSAGAHCGGEFECDSTCACHEGSDCPPDCKGCAFKGHHSADRSRLLSTKHAQQVTNSSVRLSKAPMLPGKDTTSRGL